MVATAILGMLSHPFHTFHTLTITLNYSQVFVHAGIFHIIPNVAIQLRVGGYLNLVYGTPRWVCFILYIYAKKCLNFLTLQSHLTFFICFK